MQAYHKSQKAKAIKKGKATNTKLRQEKLAKRNPFRLAARIDELKESSRPHDQKLVAELEKELAAVKKAREAAGIKDDWEREKRRKESVGAVGAGKGRLEEQRLRRERRERGGDVAGDESDSGESTSSSVRDIPLPPGPLPPLPGEEPPKSEVKTTYESAPVLRDLRKEAAAFVPTAVKRKLAEQQQSQDKKPRADEEGVSAEKAGVDNQGALSGNSGAAQGLSASIRVNAAPDIDEEELRRFQAEVEEVRDEDDYR